MTNQRCTKCGNTIPRWANGECQVCKRNVRDGKRYGCKIKPSPPSKPTSPASAANTC